MTIVCTSLFLGQAALIAAGEAHRPLERYVFYVTPLVFIAFFAYVERGAPWRLAYTLATCIGAVALSLRLAPGLDRDGRVLLRLLHADRIRARLLLHRAHERVAAVHARATRTRRGRATRLARAAARGAARRSRSRWRPVRRSTRPTGSRRASARGCSTRRPRTGSTAPTWARRRTSSCRSPTTSSARVSRAGTATSSTSPCSTRSRRIRSRARSRASHATAGWSSAATTRTLVVNIGGQRHRPRRAGSSRARAPASSRIACRATRTSTGSPSGLAPDRWTGTKLRYQAWPVRAGRYELTLSVPRGTPPRNVLLASALASRSRAGTPRRLSVPTSGAPLELRWRCRTRRSAARYLGVKVFALRFVAG